MIKPATAYRIRMKQELIEYKGGKCQSCGYCKPIPGAFAFHHRDPKEKEFDISQYNRLNRKELFAEADKCDMLCKNCHAEAHDNPELRRIALEMHKRWLEKVLKPKLCRVCGIEFQPKRGRIQRCEDCVTNGKYKVSRPPTESQLSKMLASKSWCEIGRMYGVSDNAVRKWARKMGIS